MENSKTVGERSEAKVLAMFLRLGKTVLLPFGDNQRYDLVVEEDGEFTRVQCKTGRIKNRAIHFDTCSSQSHRGKGKLDYRGQADQFGVYVPDLDKVYLVPVKDVGHTAATLRLTPPKNNQGTGVRWAHDYELSS